MEEYQEADVIWSDHGRNRPSRPICGGRDYVHQISSRRQKGSNPVNIPARHFSGDFARRESDEDESNEDGEMVPPHVLVARRVAGEMTLSVCAGSGRTLKGRDLCRLRNSVLRMTGFLE